MKRFQRFYHYQCASGLPAIIRLEMPRLMTFTIIRKSLSLSVLIGLAGLSLSVQGQRLHDKKRDELAQQVKQQAAELKSDLIFESQLKNLIAIRANNPSTSRSQLKPPAFENLLVLDVPAKKDPKPDEKTLAEAGAITLAIPATRRDEFAASIAGATIVITRRVSVR